MVRSGCARNDSSDCPWIVLNHNLFEIPETDIHSTEVQKTIFNGEVVYERSN